MEYSISKTGLIRLVLQGRWKKMLASGEAYGREIIPLKLFLYTNQTHRLDCKGAL